MAECNKESDNLADIVIREQFSQHVFDRERVSRDIIKMMKQTERYTWRLAS